ncbi:MAG TPA: protein-glutamate O-methyltransferase CheR [Ignavibacteriaceae bacterium]|nr:protein-glutamate O-methyltransferase CheR [Ignavibacteriaceae bacterium]
MNNFSSAKALLDLSTLKTNVQEFPRNDESSSVMPQDIFNYWRKFIYDSCGIYYQDNKKYLLESRLQKRINHLGLSGFEDYLVYIKNSPGRAEEIKYLYDAITINETFFFRNRPQLDALSTTVIPELIKKGKNKIRIWSAASSSGEEAYSVAITIVENLLPKYPGLEFEIAGTDLSQSVIEAAKKGLYREYSVRNTPPLLLKKYFKGNSNFFELSLEIRKRVSFRILNLFDEQSMKSMLNYDIIFCANVLIYFDLSAKIKVVSKLYNSLCKGGYLFIGYSETLHNISKAFKLVNFPKTIGYKKE